MKQCTVISEGVETIFYLLDYYVPKAEKINVPKLVLLVMLKSLKLHSRQTRVFLIGEHKDNLLMVLLHSVCCLSISVLPSKRRTVF